MMRILIQQEETLRQHRANYRAAPDIDHAALNQQADPVAALGALTKSIESFAGTLTSPIMKDAAEAMTNLAGGITHFGQGLAAFQAQAPEFSKWMAGGAIGGGALAGGALLTNFANGFGLAGSATQLSASAVALDAAAAHLGGASAGVAGASVDKPSEKGKPSIMAPILQYWLLGAGKAVIDDAINALPHPKYPLGYDKKAKPNEWGWEPFQNQPPVKSPGRGLYHMPPSGYHRDYSLGSTGSFCHSGDLVPPGGFGYISNYGLSHVAPVPEAHNFDPNLLSGKIEANVKPDQVTAKVEGQVQGSVTIRIDASDLLKATVAAASGGSDKQFKLNVGTGAPDTDPRMHPR